MKLSPQTLTVLKNFSLINSNLAFKPGNIVKTVSAGKTVVAKATLDTDLEDKFCIYDLNRFLSVLSLFDTPVLKVNEDGKRIQIASGQRRILYIGADESNILTPPETIRMPEIEWAFTVTNDMLQDLFKAMSVLGLPEVAIVGDGTKLKLEAIDMKNLVQDAYSQEIGDTDKTFKIVFSIDNLKLLPMDYNVSIGRKVTDKGTAGMAHFKGNGVEYYIAVETSSTYG